MCDILLLPLFYDCCLHFSCECIYIRVKCICARNFGMGKSLAYRNRARHGYYLINMNFYDQFVHNKQRAVVVFSMLLLHYDTRICCAKYAKKTWKSASGSQHKVTGDPNSKNTIAKTTCSTDALQECSKLLLKFPDSRWYFLLNFHTLSQSARGTVSFVFGHRDHVSLLYHKYLCAWIEFFNG